MDNPTSTARELDISVAPPSSSEHTDTGTTAIEEELKPQYETIDVASQTLVNIKHNNVDVHYITGMVVLPDGGVILADEVFYSLVLLDKDFVIKETLKVTRGHDPPRKPYDIALVTDAEAIVAYPAANMLQFITIYPNLKTGKTIPFEDRDISIWNVEVVNDKIYVTNRSKDEIIVLDINGEVQRVIDIKQVDPTIEGIRYIASNPGGIELFLTCAGKLLSMTLDGQLVRSIPIPDIHNVAGIVVDEDDNAYICCNRTHKVLVISVASSVCKVIEFDTPSVCVWPKSIGYRATDRAIVLLFWEEGLKTFWYLS